MCSGTTMSYQVLCGKHLLRVVTHDGRVQRKAMATMSVLEHRLDLMQLSHKLTAVLGSVFAAALAAAVGDGGQGGGGAGAGAV